MRWNEKYGFGGLAVGQSIFFPNQSDGAESKPALAARAYAKFHGSEWKFAARSVDGGVRVWRIHPNPKAPENKSIKAKIETGIELRDRSGWSGRPEKYGFGLMAVGDSIFFADQPKGSASRPAAASHVFAMQRTRAGKPCKFSARKEGNGVRVWRIA